MNMTTQPHPFVYLNGEFIPFADARVPITDRGFLFADSVYEVIPVYNGQPFRVVDHLERLYRSLAAIRLTLTMNISQWQSVLTDLVNKNGGGNQAVYLQVTRGVMPTRQHTFSDNLQPTTLAMSMPLPTTSIDTLRQGVSAIVLPDCRWAHCSIKSTALLPNVLLNQQANDANASEAILVRDGIVTEGTSSNVFIVKDNVIMTPMKSDCILGGITRDVVIEVAKQHQIPIQETTVTEAQLTTADEIWLTSSTREVRPVTTLDNRPVGTGKTGPMWQQIIELYQAHKQSV